MIRVADNLWIGNSSDVYNFVGWSDATAALNVAHDLRGGHGWPDVEYAQVGLVDGPGNEVAGYCAAVLALVSLAKRHEAVAVYDHDGGRALAVCMMYLNLVGGKYRPNTTAWSHWLTWEERMASVESFVNKGQYPPEKIVLPKPHAAHVEAFAKMPFGVLEALL